MEEREKKSSGVGCLILGLIAFLVPLLYVLSFGPVLGLHWHGHLPAGFLVIYSPLQWAAEFCEPFTDFLTWYKNLFRPDPVLIQ